jgi:hypothetical protein
MVPDGKPTGRCRDNLQYRNILASPAAAIVEKITAYLSDVTLWELMSTTQHLHCSELRDKIYALLGVVAKGHEGIRPDYGPGIPTLLNSVLRNAHKLKAPKYFDHITDQCRELAALLDQEQNALFMMEGQKRYQKIPSSKDVEACPFAARGAPVTLWWAAFYGHYDVIPIGDLQDGRGCTALHHAALNGDDLISKRLLDMEDIDIGIKTASGDTALSYALDDLRGFDIFGSRKRIVKLLLDADKQCRHFDINERRRALVFCQGTRS